MIHLSKGHQELHLQQNSWWSPS